MENKNQVNEWYKQALEINEVIYNSLSEIFAGNNLVSFTVGIERWHDRVNISTFMMLTHGSKVGNELRELVGNHSMMLTLSEYQTDNLEEYAKAVVSVAEEYARKAALVRSIIEK